MAKFLNPFAHLLTGKKRASEEDDDEARRAKEQEEEEAEEEEDRKARSKKARSKKAEDDEEEAEEEEENAEEEEDDAPRSKKARSKKAEDDEEEAEEDDESGVAKGRRMERKRVGAIMLCSAAAARPDLAAFLACKTSVSAKSAIEQLNIAVMGMGDTGGKASGGKMSLDERMASVERHNVGHDSKAPDASTPKGAAAAAVSLYNKHKGIK